MNIAIRKVKALQYVSLMKPGIIMGNLITMAGGFFLACQGSFDRLLFFQVLVGVFFLIGSACVLNCIIDIDIDALMSRTCNRPLPRGDVSPNQALVFGLVLTFISFSLLYLATNLTCFFVSFAGFFVYVFLYSFWKPLSHVATLLGSFAGAVPPVIGYTAVRGTLDSNAMILFAILALWQMPHFYAIAIFRMQDYSKASIPVLPIVKGLDYTKVSMIVYTIVFALVCPLLFIFGSAGLSYLTTVLFLSAGWLFIAFKPLNKNFDMIVWARKMFLTSVIVITFISLSLMLEYFL